MDGLELEEEEVIEIEMSEAIQKSLDPEVKKAVALAVSQLDKVSDKLPDNLKTAVQRLKAAVSGKEEYGYPQKVKKNDGTSEEVDQRLERIEKQLGIKPELIPLDDAVAVALDIIEGNQKGK